jgi:hypothetical protein
MFKFVLSSILIVCLAGCSAPKYNYAPTSIDISEPPIGSVSQISIGDIMLRQGTFREHDAIYLRAPREIDWAYTLHPGYYLKDGEDESAEYFSPGRGDDGGKIEKAALADPWKAVMQKKNKSDLCVITVFNVSVCNEVRDVEKRKKPLFSEDSFQQTLIYNGRVGSKINIGYREFSNDAARPAFNNNVEYDLSESKTIAYKGAELEVLDATNQFIQFRLIRNFNSSRF